MIKKSYVKVGEFSNNAEFYKCPKYIFSYKELKSDAKLLYMLILDRMALSNKNEWKDDDGFLYCYFTIEEICEILSVSKNTARGSLKQLVELELIDMKRQGLTMPNMIYLVEQPVSKNDPESIKIEHSRGAKFDTQEVQNLSSSNTNNNKTNKEETLELRSKEARPPHPSKTKKLFDTKDLEHISRVKLLEDKLEALNKNKYPSKAAAIKIELAELTGNYDNITGRDLAYYYKVLYTDHYEKPLEDFSVYFAGTMNNILKTYVKSPELMFKVLERMLVQYEYRKEKDKYPTLNCETLEKAWLMKKFIPNVLADLEREERNGGKQTEDKYVAIIAEKVKHMDQDVEYF